MELPDFGEFGMTGVESKIFNELIKLKSSKMGEIAKRTGLHRGTVYNALNSLIKKGIVSFIDEDKKRLYKITGQDIFEEIIEEKERGLLKEKDKIRNFFEYLKRNNEPIKKEEVNVYYGVDAFKTLFLEIYKICKRNNIEYLFLGRGGEMQDAVGVAFYKYTQKLKNTMKVKCRVILDRGTINLEYHNYVQGNIRYLTTKIKSPVNFWIYEDTVLLILFGSNPLISIKIKSETLSNAFRNYFESLWKMAKP